MRKIRRLFAEAELGNKSLVAIDIGLVEVSKKVSSLTYKFQKRTLGMIVMTIFGHVSGELKDSLGEYSDLDLGGTGVMFVDPVLLNDFCFFLGI